jgi:hypothetical protein
MKMERKTSRRRNEMNNIRVLDFTVHESNYIGQEPDANVNDFVIEIEAGMNEDDPNPHRFYIHLFRRQMIDFFQQFEQLKSRCGLVSDKDGIDKLLDMQKMITELETVNDSMQRRSNEEISTINEMLHAQNQRLEAQEKLIMTLSGKLKK